MVRLVQRLPFLPVIAVIFGWAAGTVVLAMPVWQLDAVLTEWGGPYLPNIIRPPLSPFGRFLCATSIGFIVSLLVLFPHMLVRAARQRGHKAVAVPNWPGVSDPREDGMAVQNTAAEAAWPEFLGARPALQSEREADEFLLEEAMRLSDAEDPAILTASASAPSEVTAGLADAADPMPVRLHQPDPVFIMEPAPVRPPAHSRPVSLTQASVAEGSIVDLLDRLERTMVGRRAPASPALSSDWGSLMSAALTSASGRPH